MKRITLLVDESWFRALERATADVYEGETCTWVSVEEVEA